MTKMTRDCSHLLGFRVFRVEAVLPGNSDAGMRVLAVGHCREEHLRFVGLRSGEERSDEEPTELVVDRE